MKTTNFLLEKDEAAFSPRFTLTALVTAFCHLVAANCMRLITAVVSSASVWTEKVTPTAANLEFVATFEAFSVDLFSSFFFSLRLSKMKRHVRATYRYGSAKNKSEIVCLLSAPVAESYT